RTTLLRALGRAAAESGAHVVVLLADERPEEVPRWDQALPEAEIFAATADEEPRDQVRQAELAMGHSKRMAEAGADVVVLVDGLSRLALGYRDPARVKRLFGAGRELGEEGTGSLTVIATVLDSDDRGAEVREVLQTTENLLLRLDAGLAAQGIVPALIAGDSRTSGEEELRDPEELEKVRRLRQELAGMEPAEAGRALAQQIAQTSSNAELLARLYPPSRAPRQGDRLSGAAPLLRADAADLELDPEGRGAGPAEGLTASTSGRGQKRPSITTARRLRPRCEGAPQRREAQPVSRRGPVAAR